MVRADGVRENVSAGSVTQEFSKKLLKWQADVGRELTKCTTFKTQAVEAANLWIFFGVLKGDVKLKLFNLILKY